MKILLVDDDEDIRAVAAMALGCAEGVQVEVLSASSGAECLQLASSAAPDCILLDLMMPGMDGLETLRRLRAQPATSGVPVIFMTARVGKDDRGPLLEAGAAGVIRKPFDPLGLFAEVQRLLAEA